MTNSTNTGLLNYSKKTTSMTLYLKSIPCGISRWDILNFVRDTPGFVALSMSEPLRLQNFIRYAWVSYDSEENCSKGKEMLDKVVI
jgi:hypothetical protein